MNNSGNNRRSMYWSILAFSPGVVLLVLSVIFLNSLLVTFSLIAILFALYFLGLNKPKKNESKISERQIIESELILERNQRLLKVIESKINILDNRYFEYDCIEDVIENYSNFLTILKIDLEGLDNIWNENMSDFEKSMTLKQRGVRFSKTGPDTITAFHSEVSFQGLTEGQIHYLIEVEENEHWVKVS